MSVTDLPMLNAGLNGLSAFFLGLGYWFIRRGRKVAHRNCMVAAVCTSLLFLAGYLTYHFTVRAITHFQNPAWFRPVYLALLLTHTVLAAAIVPLILITLVRALRARFDAHKKIARWTWPLWMYVSVTGVIIYLLLYRIFPQH
jgi:uncharacterized membrane protein YozB (DUF420 family)